MPITESAAPAIHRIGLQGIFEQYNVDAPKFFDKIAPVRIPTVQQYDLYIQEGDFGMASVVNTTSPIPTDEPAFPFQFIVQPLKYGLGWDIASEALESDIYGRLGNLVVKAKFGMHKTKEQAVANLINNATSNAAPYTNPDGQALASASHPLQTGATASNLMTDALGPLAIEKMIQNMKLMVSHRGDPDPMLGPFVLMVHPSQEFYARRIVGADRFPGTANNDKNLIPSVVTDVVASPYFTSTTFFAVRSSAKMDQPLAILQRRSPKVNVQPDVNRDLIMYRITEMYAPFAKGWRGFFYSTGAGS